MPQVFQGQSVTIDPLKMMAALVQMPDLNNDPLDDLVPDIMIYGPAKVGKTVCAASLSDQIPVDATFPLRKRIEIKDTVSVDFDKTSRFSREVMGIYMPSINLSGMTHEACVKIMGTEIRLDNWETSVFQVLRELGNRGVVNVIFDTLTSYDRVLEHHFKVLKFDNGFDLSREMRSKLIQLHVMSRTLGMRCVFICHARMPVGIDSTTTENQKVARQSLNLHARAAAQGAGKTTNVFFDMSTNATAVFRGNSSAVWPLLNIGSFDKPKRIIYPHGTDEWEGGTQLQGLNSGGEEPNLRGILNKSRAFMARQKEEVK